MLCIADPGPEEELDEEDDAVEFDDGDHEQTKEPKESTLDCRIHAVNEGKLHSPHRGKDTPISTPKDPRNIWLSSCLKTVHFHAKFQFDQLCLS